MNEIEKMYDNCNLLKPHAWSCKFDRIGDGKMCECRPCKNCKHSKQEYYHKPFTAEKQIELLQFLTKLDLYSEIVLRHTSDNKSSIEIRVSDPEVTLEDEKRNTIGEAIAAVINQRWEFLTEEGKKRIKEILE